MNERIRVDRARLAEFCRKHHIVKLAFFGSVTRADFTDNSDIDVLVEFAAGKEPGWEFFLMEEELSGILGRKADLNTVGWLGPRIAPAVLRTAEVVYATS